MKKNSSKPYVSVWMVAYNQQEFIEKAINSVLMQKTDFSVKLFIGEDFSTDLTAEICKNKKRLYPNQIELFSRTTNIGAYVNAEEIYYECLNSNSKYTALLEGDDYWSDPTKLQKQVDFLEDNLDYNACVHNSDILKNGKIKKKEWRWDSKRTTFTSIDYIYSLFFHTSSLMFRTKEINKFSLDPNILQGDMNLALSVINNKKVFFINQSMSVYRQHSGGITNTSKHKIKVNKYESIIIIIEKFNTLTKYQFRFPVWIKKQILKSLIFLFDETKAGKINFFVKTKYYFFKTLLLAYVKIKSAIIKFYV